MQDCPVGVEKEVKEKPGDPDGDLVAAKGRVVLNGGLVGEEGRVCAFLGWSPPELQG